MKPGLQNADTADDFDQSVNSGECFDTSEIGWKVELPGFMGFDRSMFTKSTVNPYTIDSPKFIEHGPVRPKQKYIQVV